LKQKTRQKVQLIVNIVLTVFSLCALTISMFAWFSTRKYADVRAIQLAVDRQEITIVRQPQSYLFPCATKIGDVTKEDFNSYCCVTGTYEIKGEGKLIVDVTNTDGVLGYVLDGTENGDYYSVIADKLRKKLGDDWQSKPYSSVQKALYEINTSRAVGTTNSNGNTEVTIVCWTQYDQFEDTLNAVSNGVYLYKEVQNLKVNVMFVI